MPNKRVLSATLAAMVATYRATYPARESRTAEALGTTPIILREVQSGDYEKRVMRTLADPSRHIYLSRMAGVVTRIASGCGESPTDWLNKLGFPATIQPINAPKGGAKRHAIKWRALMLTPQRVRALQKLIETEGDMPLEVAIIRILSEE